MKILFRADSSSEIGLGHIMRDLVLAKQFVEDEVLFACRDLSGHIMDKIPYPIMIVKSESIDELIMIVQNEQIEMLVIDHYGIAYEEEKRLKEETAVKIFVLDDTYEKHDCDVLLNHNISADEKRYEGLVPQGCELRCGSDYTLIRDEFVSAKREKRVFVAMGGSDASEVNIKVLKVLKKFENLKVDIVTTSANANLEKLKKYVKGKSWVTLHIDTKKIAKLMKKCDFAIVTPSVTVNEAYYMQVPFIAIKTAENQQEIYQYLKEKDYPVLEAFSKNALDASIFQLLKPNVVDFTHLTLDEKKMVLSWRNHPTIREWMFSKDVITLENHLKYIDTLSTRDDCVYCLVKEGCEAIGVIDLTEITLTQAKIGLYASPNRRGVGKVLMGEIMEYAFMRLRLDTIIAEVLVTNKPAVKLYKHFGFKEIETIDNLMVMELKHEDR